MAVGFRLTLCRKLWICRTLYKNARFFRSCFFTLSSLSCTCLYCSSFAKLWHFLLENYLTYLLNENEDNFLLVKWFPLFIRNTRVRNNFRPFAILDFISSDNYVPVFNISLLKQFNSNIFLLLSSSSRLLV